MTDEFINQIVSAYPKIREIWLIGSQANSRARTNSDWDYLVFSDDGPLLDSLYRDKRFSRSDIDLLVVVDTLRALNPWSVDSHSKMLCLDDLPGNLNWQRLSDTEAQYRPRDFAVDGQLAKAKRVYPHRK